MFARITRITAILEYFPGPVRVLRMAVRSCKRDALAPTTSEAARRIDFNGRRVADAMAVMSNEG